MGFILEFSEVRTFVVMEVVVEGAVQGEFRDNFISIFTASNITSCNQVGPSTGIRGINTVVESQIFLAVRVSQSLFTVTVGSSVCSSAIVFTVLDSSVGSIEGVKVSHNDPENIIDTAIVILISKGLVIGSLSYFINTSNGANINDLIVIGESVFSGIGIFFPLVSSNKLIARIHKVRIHVKETFINLLIGNTGLFSIITSSQARDDTIFIDFIIQIEVSDSTIVRNEETSILDIIETLF